MTTVSIRGVSLFVKVLGQGYPLLLMHGGPGLDHTTLLPFRRLADQFTLIFYDHRCNGRSNNAPVTSMTWENLTADAEALRQRLGFDQWAVLGHSFGGMVALEYALRYPQSLSHLLLLDTCGDIRWVQQNAPELLAKRGYSPATVKTAERFFNGQIAPHEMIPAARKLAGAYYHHLSPLQIPHELVMALRMKTRPEAFIFGFGQLLKGWTVMNRLGEICVPTLVIAGRDDFQFPPEHQAALAAGILNARLEIIERAGHNAHSERPTEVIGAVKKFVLPAMATTAKPAARIACYEAIDDYIEREMRRLRIPGVSLAIVEGDEITHLRGFGRAKPGGEPPTPTTPFFIGSLTKSFTAVAVMQLDEAGKIELDAPIQRYLPWFRVADPAASAQMTVRHLLNQTSGLPESSGEVSPTDLDDLPDATERQARALAFLELTRPVGAACEYSNMNYNLLGLIVEAASGQSYADYVQELIFTPLGMSHTYTSQTSARQNGLAMGHRYWFATPIAAPNMHIPGSWLASGGLISTAEDMARYLIMNLKGGCYGRARVLSAEGIDAMHCGTAEFRKMGISAGKYGMGWFDGEIGQTRVVWHSGTMPDFGAYAALFPAKGMGVVLLFNACHWWFNPVLTELGMGAAALLAGEQYKPTPFSTLVPWMLRGQLLIPVLQIVDSIAILRLLRRWCLEPEHRPSGGYKWGLHVLLPLVLNLLVALTLKPVLGKKRGYLMLYMPDYSWIAMVCGTFAAAWSFLRTGLILRAMRHRSK
jgi:proline-specific peptidase